MGRIIRYLLIFSLVTAAVGIGFFAYAETQPTFIDSDGFLHEPFAFLGVGSILILLAVISTAIAAVLKLMQGRRKDSFVK